MLIFLFIWFRSLAIQSLFCRSITLFDFPERTLVSWNFNVYLNKQQVKQLHYVYNRTEEYFYFHGITWNHIPLNSSFNNYLHWSKKLSAPSNLRKSHATVSEIMNYNVFSAFELIFSIQMNVKYLTTNKMENAQKKSMAVAKEGNNTAFNFHTHDVVWITGGKTQMIYIFFFLLSMTQFKIQIQLKAKSSLR